jgi:uncharacterized HAD superfamily protein
MTTMDRKSLTIAVDVDSTICDTTNHLIDYLNRTYGYKITISAMSRYRLEDLGVVDPDDIDSTFKWFWSNGLNSVPTLPGAAEAINDLATSCHIWLATSRPEYCEASTARWLREKGFRYDRLLFLPADEKVVLAPDVDIVVDDHPGTLDAFARRGVVAFTLRYPWNNATDLSPYSHLVRRCDDWREIHEKAKRIVRGWARRPRA